MNHGAHSNPRILLPSVGQTLSDTKNIRILRLRVDRGDHGKPEATITPGAFYGVMRCFSKRQFWEMNSPPLAVKCRWIRGCLAGHSLTTGCLCDQIKFEYLGGLPMDSSFKTGWSNAAFFGGDG